MSVDIEVCRDNTEWVKTIPCARSDDDNNNSQGRLDRSHLAGRDAPGGYGSHGAQGWFLEGSQQDGGQFLPRLRAVSARPLDGAMATDKHCQRWRP